MQAPVRKPVAPQGLEGIKDNIFWRETTVIYRACSQPMFEPIGRAEDKSQVKLDEFLRAHHACGLRYRM